MYPLPARPKIYHILHYDRLPSVLTAGGLWCDAIMQRRGGSGTTIGMSRIKQRRLTLPVKCHPGDNVGDYVPFYFCPRSVMLYLIYRANNPDLAYRGGQEPIIHLEADMHQTIAWAGTNGQRWAFTLSNASARYTEFRTGLSQLGEINWPAVAATRWTAPDVREGKQAEFLVHTFFPWQLVERIGVCTSRIAQHVVQILQTAPHQPPVVQQPDWYY